MADDYVYKVIDDIKGTSYRTPYGKNWKPYVPSRKNYTAPERTLESYEPQSYSVGDSSFSYMPKEITATRKREAYDLERAEQEKGTSQFDEGWLNQVQPLIGRLFPGVEAQTAVDIFESNPVSFVGRLSAKGRSEDSAALLKLLAPGITEDKLNDILGPEPEPERTIEEQLTDSGDEGIKVPFELDGNKLTMTVKQGGLVYDGDEEVGKVDLATGAYTPNPSANQERALGVALGVISAMSKMPWFELQMKGLSKVVEKLTTEESLEVAERVGYWTSPGARAAPILWAPYYMFDEHSPLSGNLTDEGRQIGFEMVNIVAEIVKEGVSPATVIPALWDIAGVWRPGGVGYEVYREEVPLGAQIATEVGIDIATGMIIGKAVGGAAQMPKALRWFLNVPERKVAGVAAKEAVKAVDPAKLTPEQLIVDLSKVDDVADIIFNSDTIGKLAKTRAGRPIAKLLGGLVATAKEPAEKAIGIARWLYIEGKAKTAIALATARRHGTSIKIFGLDADGLIKAGPLKGVHPNTIRSYPARYWDNLTPLQKEWVDQMGKLQKGIEALYRRYNIPLRLLHGGPGYQHAGRRMVYRLDKAGEVLDSAFIGMGKRPGGKAAFEKMRIFEKIEDAIKEGYRYLPEEDAMELNMRAAYKRVADKIVYGADGYLLPQISYRTTGAPVELVMAARSAKARLDIAKKMLGTLNRVVRGGREILSPNMKKFFPDDSKQLQTVIDALKEGGDTASMVQGLDKRLKLLVGQTQEEFWRATTTRARAREAAMVTKIGEASVNAPAFSGKIFTGDKAGEVAELLNKEFAVFQADPFINAVDKVNAAQRLFALAGDASILTIQTLFLAGSNPKAYGKTVGGFVKAVFDKTFHDKMLANNAVFLQDWAKSGLLLSRNGTEFTEALARGGFFYEGPFRYVGKILAPAQRGFEGALDVAGIELAKSYDYLATTPAARSQIAAFINEFRGISDTSRLGISQYQRAIESAVMLAPRYNRAIAALVGDVFRGTLRGSVARSSLARVVTVGAAMTVAVSMALGEDFEGATNHLNPLKYDKYRDKWSYNPMFMTWNIAGVNIGPGTKVRSLIALWARMGTKPESLADWNVADAEAWRSNPFLSFIRGNLAGAPSTGLDLLLGSDYIGDPTRDNIAQFSENVFAENFTPIWVQSAMFEGSDLLSRIQLGIAEFLGMRAWEYTPYQIRDTRRDQLSMQTYLDKDGDGRPWADLSRSERVELRATYPEIATLEDQASAEWTRRNPTSPSVRYREESMEKIAFYKNKDAETEERLKRGVITTEQARDQWSQNGNDKAVAMGTLRDVYAEVIEEAQKNTGNGLQQPFDICYEDWIARVMAPSWEDKDTGEFDYKSYQNELDSFVKDWGQEFYDEIQNTRNLQNEYGAIQLLSKDAAQAWQSYYETQDTETRINIRRANPEIEAELIFWGRLASFQNPDSVKLLLARLEDTGISHKSLPIFVSKPEKYVAALAFVESGMTDRIAAEKILSNAAFNEWAGYIERDPVIDIMKIKGRFNETP